MASPQEENILLGQTSESASRASRCGTLDVQTVLPLHEKCVSLGNETWNAGAVCDHGQYLIGLATTLWPVSTQWTV